jgi:hypothetical protein
MCRQRPWQRVGRGHRIHENRRSREDRGRFVLRLRRDIGPWRALYWQNDTRLIGSDREKSNQVLSNSNYGTEAFSSVELPISDHARVSNHVNARSLGTCRARTPGIQPGQRRPQLPPIWGRFFDTRGGDLGPRNIRFCSHNGLKSDISPCPFCANIRHRPITPALSRVPCRLSSTTSGSRPARSSARCRLR